MPHPALPTRFGEDPTLFAINRLPMRAIAFPHRNRAGAARDSRESSPFFHSLDTFVADRIEGGGAIFIL